MKSVDTRVEQHGQAVNKAVQRQCKGSAAAVRRDGKALKNVGCTWSGTANGAGGGGASPPPNPRNPPLSSADLHNRGTL